MIIVCKSCKGSFLVPSSIFSNGPRTVRCARCKNVWKEFPPSKPTPLPTPKPPKPASSPPPPLPPVDVPEPLAVAPPIEKTSLFAGLKELTISRAQKLLLIGATIAFGFVLFFSIVFIGAHNVIVKHWPEAQQLYIMLELAENPLKDKLVLHKIVSERRYQDGAMHLVVDGEILSQAEKRQVVPAIAVEALGPDGKIIESWRIEPPQATMAPNETVPFTSSIISPEGTVVEINLSFVEPPHDEH